MNWWDINTNGEKQLVRALKRLNRLNVVFDVGANVGEWSDEVLIDNENCNLHCFEIDDVIFSKLKARISGKNVVLNNTGLFSETKSLNFNYCPHNEGLSSIYDTLWSNNWNVGERKIVKRNVIRGDQYCQANNINKINFLKIDTEGAEFSIVKGFGDMIDPNIIEIIQFEYGVANIVSRSLLIDYYEFLTPKGYIIGKIEPNNIKYKPYYYEDENFNGANFIAMNANVAKEFGCNL